MLKVAVVTGTRAEYRLLRKTLLRMQADDEIKLSLCVTGSHLLTEQGNTIDEIIADDIPITQEFPIMDSSIVNSESKVVHAVACAIETMATYFLSSKPDCLVVLGDRYEIFATAQAALLCRIPIAHIHGGEVTAGAIDDVMRHCISKMANLHLVATETHRRRLIQLGEQPGSVFVVGAPGLEDIAEQTFLSRQQLEQELNISLHNPSLLITYHPETLSPKTINDQISTLLDALQRLKQTNCLFTAPNLDAGGDHVLQRIVDFVKDDPQHRFFIPSLGERYYLSCVNAVDAVLGNSSSGIIEVPALGVPTVNIGERQTGRERANTVIDVACDTDLICHGIHEALRRGRSQQNQHPYQLVSSDQKTSTAIVDKIKSWDWSQGCKKTFYDLPDIAAALPQAMAI